MAVSCAAFVAFAATSVFAQEAKPDLTDQINRISYAGGANMGRVIKDTGVGFKADVVIKGFMDAFEGKELLMSQEEIQKALGEFKEMMRGKEEERFKKESVENLGIAKKFLEDNKNKEGVKILPSGLQYIILKEGTGEAKPAHRDAVKVHYRGTFLDGTEFDSSLGKGDEPVVFNVNQVIPGMSEALQLMKKGSKWQLFIPPDLAYGEGGSQGIPPNALLIFEVELFDIVTQAEIPAAPESGVVVPVEPPKDEKPAAEAPKQ
jgi:FKBP-type peptidyl-prolyl cis-trans isomerase